MQATWRATVAMLVMLIAPAAPSANDEDVTRAIEAVRVRAAAGDVIARFSLGSILYYGTNDTAAGIDWIRKAALRQFPPAEFHMGQLYEFGFGVDPDDAQALVWYRRAAGHGSAAAQRAVGEFHQKGRSVPADPAEAVRWYRLAAEGDDLRAQYHLAQMYFDGTGVARDYPSAYFWFSIAAGQTPLEDNRKGLIELRDIAAARMTAAAVERAERRVKAWKPRAAR